MSKLDTKKYQFDRRQFLKHTGVYGVGVTFLAGGVPAFGQEVVEECTTIADNIDVSKLPLQPAANLQYFVDGLHFNDRSNIMSRANIAMFIQEIQTPTRYVERVILTDELGNTLGVQYFDATNRMSQGFVPYVIFENISLDYAKNYHLYYQVREGETISLFHGVLANARRSLLNSASIPKSILDDFAAYRGENNGLITTAYELYTGNAGVHSARGFINTVGSDNSFNIDVELMHGDANAGHYMRYFIVADPVGRILGFRKREFQDPTDATSPLGAAAMSVSALDDNAAIALGITPNDVAKITDCPYVQIYTEDVFDALARSTVRLR
ncbi:MAG: hypothetical protein HRU19_22145 [Pseudobacteriovorax sp.]|nr:hypothetical protein [Pseudobacteriovorax sp.]